jgi:hypothetical protein
MLANMNLIDRKNFSVSISKETTKGEDKGGPVNKNYTFQNNSEAKKIISNINKDGVNALDESKIRASLGANVINNFHSSPQSLSKNLEHKGKCMCF